MPQVKKGDTISGIAAKAKVSVAAIAAANPEIKNLNKISVGQTINIPKVDTKVKTSSNIYAGGLTGGSNPFSAGSNASQATKDKLLGVAGIIPTKVTGGNDGDTPPPPPPDEFPAAGTVLGSSSVDNGDGTFTITTIYADGKGGTYQQVTQSGVKKDSTSAEKRDAFAIIKSTLKTYGFTEAEIAELNTFIEAGLTDGKMGPEQLKLQLRELPTYKARFAGNTTRVSAGLNALSEADYLQQENDYSEIFKMYGVGNLSSRAQFSSLIGGNISVTEATKRVDAAVKRVKNGDPAVLTTLRTLYPNITDTDIVSYFLKPGEMLPELERKTTVAEIGATAGQFGMKETGLTRFEDLQRYGVTLASARAGYGTIAEDLPGATKLGNVYRETGITYGQTEAEAEQFKSSAEAKRKKEKLIETEKSSFKGSAGLNTGGLSTQYLRRSSSAGQF
jgi:murein DD-endopeptidase MepM/ murein hydrolase activator NlpD